MNYFHFLGALYILAEGLSVLETAANHDIIAMGPEETGTRRLNFAQSFNPIGSILRIFLSKVFILSNLNEATAEERASLTVEQLQKIQPEELAAVVGPLCFGGTISDGFVDCNSRNENAQSVRYREYAKFASHVQTII